MKQFFLAIIFTSFIATSVLAAFAMSMNHAHNNCLATIALQTECPTGAASVATAVFFHADFVKELSTAVFRVSSVSTLLFVLILLAFYGMFVFILQRGLATKKSESFFERQQMSGWLAHGKQKFLDWFALFETSPTRVFLNFRY